MIVWLFLYASPSYLALFCCLFLVYTKQDCIGQKIPKERARLCTVSLTESCVKAGLAVQWTVTV